MSVRDHLQRLAERVDTFTTLVETLSTHAIETARTVHELVDHAKAMRGVLTSWREWAERVEARLKWLETPPDRRPN